MQPQTVRNYQIKRKLECSEKRKPTNTCAPWKLYSSNRWWWKKKLKKEYLRRTRKVLETILCSKNLIKGINTWAVPLARYLGPFLKWTRRELIQMDQRTRKLKTMHKALHLRDDIDRFSVSRKRGRKLASIEGSIDASMQWFEDYIQKRGGTLITVSSNNTENRRTNWTTITRK